MECKLGIMSKTLKIVTMNITGRYGVRIGYIIFFSSRRRHTRCALVYGVQTCALPIYTLWSPAKAAEFVRDMEAGEIDIIIGTQLVTKGYHFPNLTLVGVIDADLGLEGGDLRASERTFQQIAQVSGRAGRGQKPGRVFIQTRSPATPVIKEIGRAHV